MKSDSYRGMGIVTADVMLDSSLSVFSRFIFSCLSCIDDVNFDISEFCDRENLDQLDVSESLKALANAGWIFELKLEDTIKEPNVNPYKKMDNSHLYLIHNVDLNVLKIGKSINPNNRLAQLQTASCYKLILAHVIKNGGHLEYDFHVEFKKFKMQGEWFKYDESILLKFKNN